MDDRDLILGRLKRQARVMAHPEPWRRTPTTTDLADRFVQALTAAGGEALQAENLEEAWKRLGEVLLQLEVRRVVANQEPPLDAGDLPRRWPEIDWQLVGRLTPSLPIESAPGEEPGLRHPERSKESLRPSGGLLPPYAEEGDPDSTPTLREFCSVADVGLSAAQAALAETGSLVLLSGPGRSRLATLLPPVHIALVPTSCLTQDLFTWTAARGSSWPSAVTLVSGPSKTADIEQTMAVGVHGPKRLVVVLYRG